MLHFTPLYKPSKGYMGLDKWEGDVMVLAKFTSILSRLPRPC